jgi:hypothetical protein
MLEIDIAADTELGDWAIKLIRDYFQKYPPEGFQKEGSKHLTEKDWPVSRAQVNGLRQVVGKEPTKIKDFADKQAEKDKKTLLEIENELKENKKKLDRRPDDEHLVKQKEKLEKRKKQLQGRVEFWTEVKKAADGLKQRYQASSDHYTAFFQRFCIHYLYEMSKRTKEE